MLVPLRRAVAAVAVALVGAALGVGLVLAGEPAQKSIHDGVFTSSQVEEGAKVYDEVCGKCHAPDLFGPDYMVGWSGATVAEFYELLQGTMPYESPGSLADAEYTNIVVYLFAINGVEAGEDELPSDVQALYDISIDGPFEWNGSRR